MTSLYSLFSASGKAVPALSPSMTAGAASRGCVAEDAQSPEGKVKGQSADQQELRSPPDMF